MSNFQIQEYYKDEPSFGGCPCIDEVSVLDPKKFYIVNQSERKDGGSHWVLLFQDLYFDSFGCPPPLRLKPHCAVWNDTQYQDFHSSACGFFCCYVADNLIAGRPPCEGLIPDTEETPERNSESVLREYFSKTDGVLGGSLFSRMVGRVKSLVRSVKDAPTRAWKQKNEEPAKLKKFLDSEGSKEVAKIEIARKPVHGMVTKALDWLSRGKFSKKKKELGYTDVMHNYLLVTMKDGRTYRVEKNARVSAEEASKSDFVKDRSNVPLHDTSERMRSLTLKEMMEKASAGDKDFWVYDAQDSNCQVFTRDVLERNGLHPEHPPEQQDAKKLLDTLPGGSKIPRVITDVAATLDAAINGGSVQLDRWY